MLKGCVSFSHNVPFFSQLSKCISIFDSFDSEFFFCMKNCSFAHNNLLRKKCKKSPDFLFSKAYYLESMKVSNASKEPELKAFILSDTTKSLQKRIILQNFPLVFTLHSQEKFASSWRRSWRLDWKASLLFSLEKPLGLRIRVEMHPLLTLTLSIFRQVESLDVMFRSETLPISLRLRAVVHIHHTIVP